MALGNRFDITINQGATFELTITWKDSAGTAINLTGFDKMRKTETFLPNMNSCGRCGVLSYCKWMNGNKSKGYE